MKKKRKKSSKKKERLIRVDSPEIFKALVAGMIISGADIAKELQIKDDQFSELPEQNPPFGSMQQDVEEPSHDPRDNYDDVEF